jgi:hypothetical protein
LPNQSAESGVHQTQQHGIKLKELLELLLNQSPKPLRYEIRNDVVTVIAAQKSTLSMTDSVFLDD